MIVVIISAKKLVQADVVGAHKSDFHEQNGEAVASSCPLSRDACPQPLLGKDVYFKRPEKHCALFRIHLLVSWLKHNSLMPSGRLAAVIPLNSVQDTKRGAEGLCVKARAVGM